MTRKPLSALGFLVASLPAQRALACAVCFSGREETRLAYLATTLFMTAIPLVALCIGAYWVVRKATSQAEPPPR